MASNTIGATPPPGLKQRWAVGTMLKIARLLELRQQVVAYSLMEVAVGFILILGGVSMGCLIIMRWNTGERERRADLPDFARKTKGPYLKVPLPNPANGRELA